MPTFDQNNTFSNAPGRANSIDANFTAPPRREIGMGLAPDKSEWVKNAAQPGQDQNRGEVESLKQQIQLLKQQIQTMRMREQQTQQIVKQAANPVPQRPQPMNLNKPVPGNRVGSVEKRILASGVKPNAKQMRTLQGLGLLQQAPELSKFQKALNGEYE